MAYRFSGSLNSFFQIKSLTRMSDSKEKAASKPKRAKAPTSTTSAVGGKAGASAAGAAGAAQSGDEAMFLLTRTWQEGVKGREAFSKAMARWDDIEKDFETRAQLHKRRMDENAAQRSKELSEMEADMERERKRRRIDLDQDLREYGSEQLGKMLAERGKQAVAVDELAQLREELAVLRQTKDEGIRKAGQEAGERARLEIVSRTETLQLKHAAELAAVNARADQQTNQIKVLQDTINSLRTDLDRQRELTKEVPPPPPHSPPRTVATFGVYLCLLFAGGLCGATACRASAARARPISRSWSRSRLDPPPPPNGPHLRSRKSPSSQCLHGREPENQCRVDNARSPHPAVDRTATGPSTAGLTLVEWTRPRCRKSQEGERDTVAQLPLGRRRRGRRLSNGRDPGEERDAVARNI